MRKKRWTPTTQPTTTTRLHTWSLGHNWQTPDHRQNDLLGCADWATCRTRLRVWASWPCYLGLSYAVAILASFPFCSNLKPPQFSTPATPRSRERDTTPTCDASHDLGQQSRSVEITEDMDLHVTTAISHHTLESANAPSAYLLRAAYH